MSELDGEGRRGGIVRNFVVQKVTDSFCVCSEDQRITPEDYLNTLHALVVLAADTHAVRAALRAEHDNRDELSRQRHQLRMAITAGQKELKEGSKSTGGQNGAKNGKKGEAERRMPTRGKTGDPKSKLAADREQLLTVDADLQAVQVRFIVCRCFDII